MLNMQTGEVLAESLDIQISPTLTRAQFLASSLGQASRITVENEPYCSFVTPPVGVVGNQFVIALSFCDAALVELRLVSYASEFRGSWQQWSKEKEQARRRFHDQLLADTLRPLAHGVEPTWGTIVSLFDERAGESAIVVKYHHIMK